MLDVYLYFKTTMSVVSLNSFIYFNRVRFAAINALGQLSTDLADEWQEEQHTVLVPTLLKGMEDVENRVRGHATSALINFCEGCPEEIIVQYLDEVSKAKFASIESDLKEKQLESL